MFLSGDIRYAAGSVADWKISLGRFLYPAYRAVFSGSAGTPWLSGVLSLVWVSLAVYLVSRLFSVDNALLPEGAQPDAMPPFPAEGSICRAGDMLIVRMG